MRIPKLLMILTVLACAPCNADDTEALSIAKRVAMGGEFVDVEANARQMTSMLIAKNPSLAEYETRIVEIIVAHLRSEEMLNGVASVYVENFSLDELKELELLMQNPVMIKWLENMPTIMPQILAVQRDVLGKAISDIDQLVAE